MSYIYLDFETNKAGDFYLAGYANGDDVKQVVLTEGLRGLADFHGVEVQTPEKFVRDLLELARKTGSSIAAYSTAEKEILRRVIPLENSDYEGVSYLNLRTAASKWINRFRRREFDELPPLVRGASDYDKRTQRKSLASVCRLIDFESPKDYAIGKTTTRFNTVISALELRGGEYGRLTRVQKAKATKAVKHNRFDVEAIICLCERITRDDIGIIGRATSVLREGAA
jgi:hypothetical protein